MPWERFLSESEDDINAIWQRHRQTLPKRIAWLADNMELLRRSREDIKLDGRRWAARAGDSMEFANELELGLVDEEARRDEAYRPDAAGVVARLVNVFQIARQSKEVTKDSAEIGSIVTQLDRFEQVLSSGEEDAAVAQDTAARTLDLPGARTITCEVPDQNQINSILKQQRSMSKQRERMIQGIQEPPLAVTMGREAELTQVETGFGEGHIVVIRETDPEPSMPSPEPTSTVQWGPSTSFEEAGRQVAQRLTLNRRQTIAFLLICRQLDRLRGDTDGVAQHLQFLGGEGGTGKSRVIQAITELMSSRGMASQLLVTATSGVAAAQINGVTIHSACSLSIAPGSSALVAPSRRRVDGSIQASWQEKLILVIDEVSMLGGKTLHKVNQALKDFRSSPQDFGGIPIVLFSGDFHQFSPVRERSILIPAPSDIWRHDGPYEVQAAHQHGEMHALWKKFTTVVLLTEQVRAAGDERLRRLLGRIRQGIQDEQDLSELNRTCHQPGRRIPWESGLTVVTPLNRNRWHLNMEAALSFQRQHQRSLRIFLAEHTWTDGGRPTEEEVVRLMGLGDDSHLIMPAVFMFVPGMPVVVTKNTHQGLKLVNGASYTAVDVIVDRQWPGHQVDANTLVHFGPPAAILLTGETTQDLHFVGLPPATILLKPTIATLDRQPKRPWQTLDVKRRGLPCTAAFACTDYKVQGRTLDQAALELRGKRGTRVDGEVLASGCDAYSLYVQLSRCRRLEDIMLISEARPRDFVRNQIPAELGAEEARLEQLSEATLREAENWYEEDGS